MAQDQPTPPTTFTVAVPDAPDLPMLHVNALNIRFSVDEFFISFGVVLPPDVERGAPPPESRHLTAQPVGRFAISRQVMAKFLDLMVAQYNRQTQMLEQLVREADEHE